MSMHVPYMHMPGCYGRATNPWQASYEPTLASPYVVLRMERRRSDNHTEGNPHCAGHQWTVVCTPLVWGHRHPRPLWKVWRVLLRNLSALGITGHVTGDLTGHHWA
jgi:hypothetical protein